MRKARRKIAALVAGALLGFAASTSAANAAQSGVLAAGADASASVIGTTYTVRIDPYDRYGSALGASGLNSTGIRDNVAGQLWNNTSGQRWKMKVVDTYNGWWIVTFQNLRYSNICLDKSLDTDSTDTVYLYTCTGALNQQWLLLRNDSIPGGNVHWIQSEAWQTYGLDNSGTRSWVSQYSGQYAIYVL
jgi:hypothetical protein